MSVLRRYRFLLVVVGIAGLIAIWEPPRPADFGQEDYRQDLEQKRKVIKILSSRYPKGQEVQAFLGMDAAKQQDFVQARKYFEEALASGVKTDENNFYLYALTLVAMDAPQEEIDQAVTNWKYNYPFSNRRDPSDKQALKEYLRSQAAQTEQ